MSEHMSRSEGAGVCTTQEQALSGRRQVARILIV